jgi:hypothetical protein
MFVFYKFKVFSPIVECLWYTIFAMSTPNTSIKQRNVDQKITEFGYVRIDDLFICVEKNESSGCTCYQIAVTPNMNGTSMGVVKSAGCAIYSDEDAVKFLERLEELKTILKLPSF